MREHTHRIHAGIALGQPDRCRSRSPRSLALLVTPRLSWSLFDPSQGASWSSAIMIANPAMNPAVATSTFPLRAVSGRSSSTTT